MANKLHGEVGVAVEAKNLGVIIVIETTELNKTKFYSGYRTNDNT